MTTPPSSAFSFHEASQEIQFNLTPSQGDVSSSFTPLIETEKIKLIWGTTINVQDTSDKFKDFVRLLPNFVETFDFMNMVNKFTFNLDCSLLPSLIRSQLTSYPTDTLPIFQNSLHDICVELFPMSNPRIVVRPYNVGEILSIRNVDPKDIERIVRINGMVVRSSQIIPEIEQAHFKCIKCDSVTKVEAVKNIIAEPICACGSKFTFQLLHNRGEYSDKQLVRLQELPEGVPDGTTPMSATVLCKGDLVDSLVPGDKVVLTGILKAVPIRISQHFKKMKSSFRVYLELLSHQVINKKIEKIEFISEIDCLRKNPNIYEVLASSIAPSVFGLRDVKKALLLQLFGGVSKKSSYFLRGDLNILLAGDPGISKSQLLSFIHRISDRGMYTSGRGSSAVGLTASVTKDPDSGQFVLESGALVLSDNGICCIDEFDKMNESTRSVLHEVMEQQTVSVAKAGIITTLNARCSILASCNPIESKYNPNKSIIENINLPPTLLSRFDVICLMIDKSNEAHDQEMSSHILSMFGESSNLTPPNNSEHGNLKGVTSGYVSIDLLKAYIAEAKKLKPKLTTESKKALTESYIDLRQLDSGRSITATTRQLESLIRLSEAHARMRFSSEIEIKDVREATRIIKESLLMYATDPSTGKIDMNMIITGRSNHKLKIMEDLKAAIKILVKHPMSIRSIAEHTGAEEKLVGEAVSEMEDDEIVYVDKRSHIVEILK